MRTGEYTYEQTSHEDQRRVKNDLPRARLCHPSSPARRAESTILVSGSKRCEICAISSYFQAPPATAITQARIAAQRKTRTIPMSIFEDPREPRHCARTAVSIPNGGSAGTGSPARRASAKCPDLDRGPAPASQRVDFLH